MIHIRLNIKSIFIAIFLLLNSSLSFAKVPPTDDLAIRNLELLFTRVWVKESKTWGLPDVPGYISQDKICLTSTFKDNKFDWTTGCTPVKMEKISISEHSYLRLSFSSGVNHKILLGNVQKILKNRNLGTYANTKADQIFFDQNISNFLKKVQSPNQTFTLINTSGKTSPYLENLFSLKSNKSFEIIDLMNLYLSSEIKISTDDKFITTFVFKNSN
jgi:hypothetical protein